MANYPGLTIGGTPVLASSSAGWTLRPGTAAPIYEFDVAEDAAESILTAAKPRTFAIQLVGSGRINVNNVLAISRGVSSDPNIARVRVTDRRFVWPYIHIGPRRYNMRRKVGVKRLANPQNVREMAQLADNIRYHPGSLMPSGSAWTAVDVLKDVLETIVNYDSPFGTASVTYELGPGSERLPIENLQIDDNAANALARVLTYLPGTTVTIDLDGSIRVYAQTTGDEKTLFEDSGAESVGGGHVQLIDLARIRPSAIDVLFEREIEVRFDADETGTVAADAPYLENVAPVPDYELDLGGRLGTVPQGTWVSFPELLAAWNRSGTLPGIGAITVDTIQKAMVPYMDLWAGAQISGQRVPDADWTARIATILRHYRQTFRISPKWRDAIRGLYASRVGLINVATGTRGVAVAYSDFCYIASQRAGLLALQSGGDVPYAINVARYPSNGLITATTKPAPCDVSILDEDQGIVRFDYKPDLLRVFEAVLPSQIETEGDSTQPGTQAANPGPVEDYTQPDQKAVAFNAIRSGGKLPRLTRAYKAATILTALPAYPNSEAALCKVTVRPEQIAGALPDAFRSQLKKCYGPVMQVRIGADIATALVPWIDANRDIIGAAFGVTAGGANAASVLDGITLNLAAQSDIGDRAASLNAIAAAAAAAIYAAYCDHYEGSKTVPISGPLRPSGWIGSIGFNVRPDGRTECTITSSGPRERLNIFAFLDSNTRALVLRLARS